MVFTPTALSSNVSEVVTGYSFATLFYVDNLYTSPILLEELLEMGIVSTGTLNVKRRHVPSVVVAMKKSSGKGYYFRHIDSKITFCVWHDPKTLAMASTAFPGHSEGTVTRRVKHAASGTSTTKQVPCPLMLTKYKHSMGGFDKSDQYISYHKVLRPTVKDWKTTFFHVLDICSVNSHIHYNWYGLKNSSAILPKNQFRVLLILQILHPT